MDMRNPPTHNVRPFQVSEIHPTVGKSMNTPLILLGIRLITSQLIQAPTECPISEIRGCGTSSFFAQVVRWLERLCTSSIFVSSCSGRVNGVVGEDRSGEWPMCELERMAKDRGSRECRWSRKGG